MTDKITRLELIAPGTLEAAGREYACTIGRGGVAALGEKKEGDGWVAFEERSFESFRSYYQYLPKGVVRMEYTMRLNNAGEFSVPPSRVEAMYAPEMFGESPNARLRVLAGQ